MSNPIRLIRSARTHAACLCAVGALALAGVVQVQAQTIYRVMGPDGKITFSDKLPPANANATATTSGRTIGTLGAGGGGPSLPFELNQVAGRFPVTLYTGNACVPCDAGRALLKGRGIPFAEKTISTSEDSDALKRLSGETTLPFLTIGAQQIKGFSDTEWNQFLSAAGYPQSSALPPGYRNPPAAPLVAVQKPASTAKPEEKPASAPTPAVRRPAPVDPRSNPAGIKF